MLIPVAEKLVRASRRCTTRTEDLAYCLMGIFDVNMPLLYREGCKAFKRLQEEIIRQTNTYTIFAWQTTDCSHVYHGALAPSLQCFDLSRTHFIFNSTGRSPSVSPHGVRMEVYLKRREAHEDLYEAVLPRKRYLDRLSPSILVLHIPGKPLEPEHHRKIFAGDDFAGVDASHINYVDVNDWPLDLRNRSKMEVVLNNVSTISPQVSMPELTQELFIVDDVEPQEFLGDVGEAISFSFRNYLTKPKFGKMIGLLYNFPSRWFIAVIGRAAHGSPWCQILSPKQLDPVVKAHDIYRAFSLESDTPLLATHRLDGIYAAVWLSYTSRRPILCVSVDIDCALEIVQAV
jgi:hypothetical protein